MRGLCSEGRKEECGRAGHTYTYTHLPSYTHHIILGGTKPVGAVARVFVVVSFCWLAVGIGLVLPCRRGVAKDDRDERTDDEQEEDRV